MIELLTDEADVLPQDHRLPSQTLPTFQKPGHVIVSIDTGLNRGGGEFRIPPPLLIERQPLHPPILGSGLSKFSHDLIPTTEQTVTLRDRLLIGGLSIHY